MSSEALCTEDVIYHFHTAILRQDYETFELLQNLEDSLTLIGINTRDCQLRAVCDIIQAPVNILQEFRTPFQIFSNFVQSVPEKVIL